MFKDGFSHHANKILTQVEDKGFCTKSQLEFLVLHNKNVAYNQRVVLNQKQVNGLKIFNDFKKEAYNKLGEDDKLSDLMQEYFDDEEIRSTVFNEKKNAEIL